MDEALGQVGPFLATAGAWVSQITIEDILANKIARAFGMAALVLATIWVIALVYNGNAQDSELAVGLRVHPNRKLGEGDILFDQSIYPQQMNGVEAVGRVFFVYDSADRRERTPRKIAVTDKLHLKLHVRVSPIPKDSSTQFGFECTPAIAALDQRAVTYPPPDASRAPDQIASTPGSVGEYVALHDLAAKWTDDDDVPIVSLGATQLELLTSAREEHIIGRARAWSAAQKPGLFNRLARNRAVRERANLFGSYYIKLQFSKRPDFVLFQHPNKELKMTAWLTVLTSFFSIAMDLWPVERQPTAVEPARPPGVSRPASAQQTSHGLPPTPGN